VMKLSKVGSGCEKLFCTSVDLELLYLSNLKMSISPSLASTTFLIRRPKKLVAEMKELDQFIESLSTARWDGYDSAPPPPFAGLRYQGLKDIEAAHGRSSKEYKSASEMFKNAIEAAVLAFKAHHSPTTKVITIIVPPNQPHHKRTDSIHLFSTQAQTLSKRAPSPTPIVPINQLCFKNQGSCMNETGNCSSHGMCYDGSQAGEMGCWVCGCNATVSNGKTTFWSGSSCQKEDLSTQFFLIVGSTLLLLVIVLASVGLLFGSGSSELPQVLSAVGGMSHHRT